MIQKPIFIGFMNNVRFLFSGIKYMLIYPIFHSHRPFYLKKESNLNILWVDNKTKLVVIFPLTTITCVLLSYHSTLLFQLGNLYIFLCILGKTFELLKEYGL